MSSPEMAAALYRQQRNFELAGPETVASIALEHDHTRPAGLGTQQIRVSTEVGTGWLPVSATHPLDRPLHGITEAIIVTHGVLRNVGDYFLSSVMARGKVGYDSARTLIVAPHFPAPVDPVDYYMLRWGYNDWRGGEPAAPPLPPVSSFDAKDALVYHLAGILSDWCELKLRGNSEGGQQDDRYLAFSGALKWLEQKRSVRVSGLASNPGTVLCFDNLRPQIKFPANGDMPDINDVGWFSVPHDSPANRWPFGMFDPPPYITRYLQHYSLDEAITDYVRRTTLCVGALDNNPNGSQLPVGPGPDEQGPTRYARVIGKWFGLRRMGHNARLMIAQGLGHDALPIFTLAEELGVAASRSPLGDFVLDGGL